MKEQDKELNLYQKLAKIRKSVEVVRKNKKGYNYTYTDEEALLAKITVGMETYGVSLIPGIVPSTTEVSPYHTTKTKCTKDGEIYEENVNEIIVKSDMTYTWVNNENPEERIVVPWALVGHQADASQSFGSGLSYSSRYFLLKYFNVATTKDDPDAWRGQQKATELEEDKLIASEIVKRIDRLIVDYLRDNPNKKDDVKEIATKYAKNGNYKSITESVVASKLLDEIQKTFDIKE